MPANTLHRFALILVICIRVLAESPAQHTNYVSNAMYFCQLQQKYDGIVGGGFGRNTVSPSGEWQAAFSPVSHAAVMFSYSDGRSTNVRKEREEGVSINLLEIGVGVYEHTARGTASVFVGYGQGSVFNNYLAQRTTSFDLQRWFVQPAVVFRSKNFEWGAALRFTRLLYSDGEIDFTIGDYELRSVRAIEETSPFLIPELGLHVGLVLRPFTVSLNVVNLFYDTRSYNFERLKHSLLLTFDLGELYQRKKKVPAE